MKSSIYMLLLTMLIFDASVFAEDLDAVKANMKKRIPVIADLKDKGIVGENNKGYLEFLTSSRQKEGVVSAENNDRRRVYAYIAKLRNKSVEIVGKVRARQIARNAPSGLWLQDKNGQWYKKKEVRGVVEKEPVESQLSKPLSQREKVSVGNFKIVSFKGVWASHGTLRVIGEVKNIGNIAAGVQIEAIARDANGQLVDTAKFWPYSTKNIPSGSSTGFKYPLTDDRSAKTVEVKVIDVKVW
jgi:uncharacterized protein YdbL (DUF1318 family)